jgi:hypothetical protein
VSIGVRQTPNDIFWYSVPPRKAWVAEIVQKMFKKFVDTWPLF